MFAIAQFPPHFFPLPSHVHKFPILGGYGLSHFITFISDLGDFNPPCYLKHRSAAPVLRRLHPVTAVEILPCVKA